MQHLKTLSAEILERLRRVIGDRQNVRLHEPLFAGNEWTELKECLDSGWVSSVGPYVDKFEKKLQEYTGASYVVALANGTAALHASLFLNGVGAGDEVLVPDLTFVATANAITYCGAAPVFVDSEWKTLGVDVIKLRQWLEANTQLKSGRLVNTQSGRTIKALIAVHIFGHPVDVEALSALCREYQLIFIEDAAESLGSFYKGKHTGTFAPCGVLSFNGNKIVTTGGGGALLFQDVEFGKKARHILTTAKRAHAWRFDHDAIGYNYRMPNLNAALGFAQLQKLPEFLERKRKLAGRYEEAFREMEGVQFFKEPASARSNYWLNTLVLDKSFAGQRDEILDYLNEKGMGCRPAWTLMHRLPMFKDCQRMDVSNAEEMEARILNIPSSAFL